jgi:quercetin dioxygenase-like cupin family protein
MTLARDMDRLESARLVLRRVAPDDLPFFTHLHALPEVAQYLYPGGQPRSAEETAKWLRGTVANYERLTLGQLAVVRKEDGALIGRCGLTDLAVTKSLFHLHHDSDEVAWVLAGEITFKIADDVSVGGPGTCAFLPRHVPHAWKNTGGDTARVVFLYTPAAAGGYVEELLNRPGPMNDDERQQLHERYRWEIVGPNPL